jgi:hypothetical protein
MEPINLNFNTANVDVVVGKFKQRNWSANILYMLPVQFTQILLLCWRLII